MLLTQFDIMLAEEDEIEAYYLAATKQLNDLLEKYAVHHLGDELANISVESLKTFFSQDGYFTATPLKAILFDHKQPFVPAEIAMTFREFISHAPENIRAQLYQWFLLRLKENGWDKLLLDYFKKHYDLPADGTVILEELQQAGLASGIYRVTWQLRNVRRDCVTVF